MNTSQKYWSHGWCFRLQLRFMDQDDFRVDGTLQNLQSNLLLHHDVGSVVTLVLEFTASAPGWVVQWWLDQGGM